MRKSYKILSFIFLFLVLTFSLPLAYSSLEENIYGKSVEVIKDFFIEAIKGNVAGTTTLNKFGENLAVGTSIEDIQIQGGILTFLTSAEKMNISSSSTDDTIAGTGARKVFILGLDGDFNEISEIVDMDGTTVSQTTNEFIRVYRMYVFETGSYGGTNLGTINAIADLNNTVQIEIRIGMGQSQTTHYTVPAGKNAVVKSISITMNTGKILNVGMVIREFANNTVSNMQPYRQLQHWHGLDTPITIESFSNKNLNEKTDIWFEASVPATTAEVEINYDIILYDK